MFNGIHLHTAGGYAEGSGLDSFEFLDGGGGGAGNQMALAYVKREEIWVLYVRKRVSMLCPRWYQEGLSGCCDDGRRGRHGRICERRR